MSKPKYLQNIQDKFNKTHNVSVEMIKRGERSNPKFVAICKGVEVAEAWTAADLVTRLEEDLLKIETNDGVQTFIPSAIYSAVNALHKDKQLTDEQKDSCLQNGWDTAVEQGVSRRYGFDSAEYNVYAGYIAVSTANDYR